MEEGSKIPNHIAIIPDGNRRWGRAHGIIPHEGIREGAKRFRDISKAAFKSGISYVTFWAASEDNFQKRAPQEVKFMLQLLKREGTDGGFLKEMKNNRIRIRWIGKWREILGDEEVNRTIDSMEEDTKEFNERNVTLLYGYNGTSEMLSAINELRKKPDTPLTYESVHNALWTRDLPPVDLVIRTGGEPHWSAGFMMWLTSDSQLYFTDTLWPDFTESRFAEALQEYSKRTRRFGK